MTPGPETQYFKKIFFFFFIQVTPFPEVSRCAEYNGASPEAISQLVKKLWAFLCFSNLRCNSSESSLQAHMLMLRNKQSIGPIDW